MAGQESTSLSADPAGEAPLKQVRKSRAARRADLVAAARHVLTSDHGEMGLAEIAQAAQVSRALLYRYFPGGRPELVAAVEAEMLDELLAQVHRAAAMPFSPGARLEQVLAAVFTFFGQEPGAYWLLAQGRGPGQPEADGPRLAAHVSIVAVITELLADSGQPAEDVAAIAAGLVGFVLATVELCLHGELTHERGWQLSCRCARLLSAPERDGG